MATRRLISGKSTPYRSQLSIQSLCQPISKSNSLSRPSTTSSGSRLTGTAAAAALGMMDTPAPRKKKPRPRSFTKTELRQVEVRTLLRAGTPLPQIAKQASNNIMIPSSRNPCSQCFNQHVSAFASVHIVTTKTLWISFPWFYNSPGGLWQEVDHEGTGQAGRGDRGGEEQVLRGDQPGFDGKKQWKTS